jgi:hypothetical protein
MIMNESTLIKEVEKHGRSTLREKIELRTVV